MLVRSFAKINWSLFVKGKLPNGYHDLDMIMQSVGIYDELEINTSSENVLCVNGEVVEDIYSNLCFKAIYEYNRYTKSENRYHVKLTKNIPIGAGLGGGSADAAAVLFSINKLSKNYLSHTELMNLALKIGADVPFMLQGGFARVSGIGEKIQNIENKNKHSMLIIFDNIFMSTAEVFKNHKLEKEINNTDKILQCILSNKINRLNSFKLNSLLKSAEQLNHKISLIIDECYENKAILASMTGSGSAVFAIFENDIDLLSAQRKISLTKSFCKVVSTKDRSIEIISD